jgi:sodium-dependent dicarboxylate transporter 2/3/5
MPRLPRWISALIALVVLIVPSLGALDRALALGAGQGIALGIVLAALVLWVTEAVPLFVTSVGIALAGATLLGPALGVSSDTFIVPFASDVILLFLGGFVLSAVMERHGLAERLARVVLAQVGGGAPLVLLAVLLTTGGLSMWMSNTAATAMMLALLGAILPVVPKGDPLRISLVLAVAAGANLGGIATPIGTPPNAIALASLDPALAPSFVGWMVRALPVLAVACYAAWRLLLWWFPPTAARIDLPYEEVAWSGPAIAAAALAGVTVVLWLTAGIHPLSLGTVGLLPVFVAFGTGLLPPAGLRALPWDVLFIVGGGLCLGAVVAQSGLDKWVLAALPLGGLGSLVTLLLLVAIAVGLSTFMSNTAAANLILPIALGIPTLPPTVTAMAVALACSCTMVLPVSTPPNAMVFATEAVDSPTFVKVGLAMTGIGIGSILLVGLPWWALIAWIVS